jgi:hypothetical protein
MTLSIIGAGFGRTGTLSLKGALEMLGFGPCYHMVEVIQNPHFSGYWEAIVDGGQPDWEKIFAGYHSTTDWPACTYYAELAAYYPKAKVILSLRDADAWYASIEPTVFAALRGAFRSVGEKEGSMGQKLIAQHTFGGNLDDRDHAIAVYERHNAAVRAAIPADRLLVYDLAEGWEPLCKFLDVPIPAAPMPKVNTTDEFLQRLRGGG